MCVLSNLEDKLQCLIAQVCHLRFPTGPQTGSFILLTIYGMIYYPVIFLMNTWWKTIRDTKLPPLIKFHTNASNFSGSELFTILAERLQKKTLVICMFNFCSERQTGRMGDFKNLCYGTRTSIFFKYMVCTRLTKNFFFLELSFIKLFTIILSVFFLFFFLWTV